MNNNQKLIDEFVVGWRTQLLDFIEQNNLIPHGHHYDVRISLTRYREQIEAETKTYMNGPNWEPSKERPTEEEWNIILSLPALCDGSRRADYHSEFLLEMKNTPGGVHTHFRHYPTQINHILEDAASDFRVFTKNRKEYVVRKIR